MALTLSHPIKKLIKTVLAWPPLGFITGRYRGLGTILMYHSITAKKLSPSGFDPNINLTVHMTRFDEQLRYLAQTHNCLSLDEAIKRLREGTLTPGAVVITFDDGYKDNLRLALPLLEKYQIPAAVFITTGLIERKCALWWLEQEFIVRGLSALKLNWKGREYQSSLKNAAEKTAACNTIDQLFKGATLTERHDLVDWLRMQCAERFNYDHIVLTWDELRELDRSPLITIGAHTCSHPNLRACDEAELESELRVSKSLLEQQLGHEIKHFAYPYGLCEHAGAREFEAVAKCGYEAAVTVRPGHLQPEHREHLTALPRICIDYFDTLADFKWKLTGCASMLAQKGRRVVTD